MGLRDHNKAELALAVVAAVVNALAVVSEVTRWAASRFRRWPRLGIEADTSVVRTSACGPRRWLRVSLRRASSRRATRASRRRRRAIRCRW